MRGSRSWAAVAFVVIACGACSSGFGMPDPANRQGRDIFDLWRLLFVASVIVAAIVYGLIAFSVIRYRGRGRDEVVSEPREHPVLEIVYTAIPIVIVVVLWAVAWRTDQSVRAIERDPAVTVEVEAYSWGWRFSYPELGVTVISVPDGPIPQMVLPLGETASIRLTSLDVIHAWYVPAFLYKRDAVPGRVAEFDITPEETGVFPAVCAEFCGLNHAFMRFEVRVVPASEFDAWAASTSGASGSVPTPTATAIPMATGPTGSTAEA